MPRSRRHSIMGATRLEESLSPTVLPELQKIRPAVVPVPVRPVAVGHRVHDTRGGRRPGRPAFRPRRPLPRGSLRGMALLLDHPSRPDRYAHHGDRDAEHRHGEHRQKLQHRHLQFAVSLSWFLFIYSFPSCGRYHPRFHDVSHLIIFTCFFLRNASRFVNPTEWNFSLTRVLSFWNNNRRVALDSRIVFTLWLTK